MIALSLPNASTFASKVDGLFDFILWTSVVSFILIVGAKVYFLFKYRRCAVPENKTMYLEGHAPTEIGVGVVLTIWVMVIFWWSWKDYKYLRTAPRDAMQVNVLGVQWKWIVQYKNGRKLTNELVVPKGKPVKLIMTSDDVLHSFYVPAFRVKQDVLPKTYTSLWFEATEVGEFPVFCAEYCGLSHSGMIGKVRVLEPADFEAWELNMTEASAFLTKPLEEQGKELATAQGCVACHSVDGTPMVGPSWKGKFGSIEKLSDGTEITVEENYIRESIMEPNAKLVQGFAPVMMTYKGRMSEEEVNAVIAYIRSLK